MMPTRLIALLMGPALWAAPSPNPHLAKVEAKVKGRLGLYALRGERSLGHRASERFAYCSTFKWVLGAAVLKAVEEGQLTLEQPVAYGPKDLLPHSPVTAPRVQEGRMRVGELCEATITTSDNTAADLLERLVGGLSGMQAFVRRLGDTVMRFDRLEPELNTNRAGDPRDTTTPEAMARLLRSALEGEVLSLASKAQLLTWMKATRTGERRIKAVLPPGWQIAHKTGTSGNGAVNDVAVLLPPKGDPIYLAVFVDARRRKDGALEDALAEAARRAIQALP